MILKNKNVIFATLFMVACTVVAYGDSVFASTYTLNMTSSGAQSISVLGSGNDAAISADNINVTTSCPYGYNFTISSSVNDNNLYLDGDSSNNVPGNFFSPVDGVSTLNNSNNSWGYYFNSDTTVVPTTSSVFNPVPVLGQADIIKSPLTNPSSTDIDDTFKLYYGVKTGTSITTGTYKMIPDVNNANNDGVIVYQTTIADSCMRYTVVFNPTSTANNTTISGTGTMESQTIYEGVSAPLNTNTFTAPNGYEFNGWNTFQDGTGVSYADGQSVMDLIAPGNAITLYAQWEELCPGGKICYKANGDDVEGTMGEPTIGDTDTSTTLLASNFSREGYGFAGWNTKPDYTGDFYGPQEDISFSAGQYSTDGLKLYAIWIESAGSLQDSSIVSQLCGTGVGSLTPATNGLKSINSVSALTDQRDNETYAIAKLADGNCWMIENLRLENTAEHNSDGTLAQGYAKGTSYGNFSGLADPEDGRFGYELPYDNSLYTIYAESHDGLIPIKGTDEQYVGYRMPRYNNWNTQANATDRPSSPVTNDAINTTTNAGMYSYGNYYTWSAALANTILYYGPTSVISTKTSETVNTSLCPSGWRLPYGRNTGRGATSKGFSYLDVELGGTGAEQSVSEASDRWRAYPNNFLYSGYFNASFEFDPRYPSRTATSTSIGEYSYYWTSTAANATTSYVLKLDSAHAYPGTSSMIKAHGLTVRCVIDV